MMKKQTVFMAGAFLALVAGFALTLFACAALPVDGAASGRGAVGKAPTQATGKGAATSASAPKAAASAPVAAPVLAASNAVSLDAVIAQAARRMEDRLPRGTKVAIVSVASPSTAFSGYVIDSLEGALVDKGTLKVVDRANLDKIRAEQGFQLSGEVSDASAKSIGQLLGAGAIVTGSLLNIGEEYRLTLKAINIESAEVAVSYPADIIGDSRVKALLASRGNADAVRPAAAPAAAAPVAAAPAKAAAPAAPVTPKTYKIGDTGPSGGIVFYDKGNNTGGWRYLEAAPAEAELTVEWGGDGTEIGGTGTAIGSGKRNTAMIASRVPGSAAQRCAAYSGGWSYLQDYHR